MISFRAVGVGTLLDFPSRRVETAEVMYLRSIRPGVNDEAIEWETAALSWTRIIVVSSLSGQPSQTAYSSHIIPEMQDGNHWIIHVEGGQGSLNLSVTLEPSWRSGYEYDRGDQRFAWRLGFNVNATALIERWCMLGKPAEMRMGGYQPAAVPSVGYASSSEPFTPGQTLSEMERWDQEIIGGPKPEKPEPVILNQRQLREWE